MRLFARLVLLRSPLASLVGALVAATARGADFDARRDATVEVVDSVMPSVVNIATETIQPLSFELAENFGRRPRDGLLIAGVDSDGPAARSELRPGDLIAGIDGQATPDILSAAGALILKKKGERVELNAIIHRRSQCGRVVNQGTVDVRVR